MLKKIMSSLPKGRKSASADGPAVTVDISRVLRKPAENEADALPEPAAEAEAAPDFLEEEIPMEPASPVRDELGALAEDAVDSLAERFEIWMRVDLDTLVDAWKDAQQPGAAPDKYRAVFTAAHNIKGAAPS